MLKPGPTSDGAHSVPLKPVDPGCSRGNYAAVLVGSGEIHIPAVGFTSNSLIV